jgi:hypothetical protein
VDEANQPDRTAPAGRDPGGCPVMHEDFSRFQDAGFHWQWADELREGSI